MNTADLNLALARSFEPEPLTLGNWDGRRFISDGRCWFSFPELHVQPRDFTEPEMVILCLKYLNRSGMAHREKLYRALLDDIQDSQLEMHIATQTAKARNVWLDTPIAADRETWREER